MEAAFARHQEDPHDPHRRSSAFCALGFGLFSQPALESLYLERHAARARTCCERGLILSLSGIAALPFLPFVGRYFDRKYRKDPAKALALVGRADPAVGAVHAAAVQRAQHHVVRGSSKIPQAVLTASRVRDGRRRCCRRSCPYRLRGMGTAMSTLYIFFIGGFMGGLLAGFFTDAIGVRGTVIILGVPRASSAALLLMNGARYIRNDLSLVVEELLEEQDEHRQALRAEDGDVPLLQLANIDFSYGPVQVLFDVELRGPQGRDASRCSARTARASRRSCASSAGSRCPSAAWCGSTARTSRTSRPSSGPSTSASCSCPAARACSRASRSSRTWR